MTPIRSISRKGSVRENDQHSDNEEEKGLDSEDSGTNAKVNSNTLPCWPDRSDPGNRSRYRYVSTARTTLRQEISSSQHGGTEPMEPKRERNRTASEVRIYPPITYALNRCPDCGTYGLQHEQTCRYCGITLVPICPQCGANRSGPDRTMCPGCGPGSGK